MIELYKNLSMGLAAVALTLAAFGAGVYGVVSFNTPGLTAAAADAQPFPPVVLADDALVAKAAVILDARTNRIIYQKNANEQLPLASITKLMTVETVLDYTPPETIVTISRDDLRPEGDSGLVAGQKIALSRLLELALVASSNDAIEAALNSVGHGGVELMNKKAKDLGLTQAHFFNSSGLDVTARTSGGYASAYDTARLAALFYKHHPRFFEMTTRAEVSVEGGEAMAATTVPLQNIPGFVAAKTGYTDLAGGNLVAIFDLEPGLTVVAVALGSTREERFTDVKRMIEAAREALRSK